MGLFDEDIAPGGAPPTDEDLQIIERSQQKLQQEQPQPSPDDLPPAAVRSGVPTPPGVPRITVAPDQQQQQPAPPPSGAPANYNPFLSDIYSPQPPAAVPPGEPNKVFGELKPSDESWTQWAKWKAMDALSAVGLRNADARHFGNALVDIPASLTPFGSVLSAADLTYDLPRGNYVGAGFDALGVIPGYKTVRNAIKPAETIAAHTAPSYLQDVPAVVGGDSPQRMGFVTPTVEELTGRGGAPNVSSNPKRAAYEASLPPSAGPVPPANTQPGSARNAYAQIRYSPMMYDPAAASDVAHAIETHLQNPAVGGFTQFKAPLVYDTVADFERRMAAHGGPITPSDFDVLRQNLRGLPDANGPAGEQAIRALDQYMFQPPPGRVIAGTPQDLAEMRQNFQTARGDWRAGKTAETVQNAIDRAEINAAVANSGMNQGNQTRQQIRSLIATPQGQEKIFGATDAELQNLLQVSKGDFWTNRARYMANKLGGGGGLGKMIAQGAGATAGGYVGGVPGAIVGKEAAGFGGHFFKTIENERTVRAADEAVQSILRNSPEYTQRLNAAGGAVSDPRVIARNAIAQAMIGNPTTRNWLQNKWYGNYVPSANRDKTPPPDTRTLPPFQWPSPFSGWPAPFGG
jgi:hypothetical protein